MLLALSDPLDFKPSCSQRGQELAQQATGWWHCKENALIQECVREKEIREPRLGVLAEQPMPPVMRATAAPGSSAHRAVTVRWWRGDAVQETCFQRLRDLMEEDGFVTKTRRSLFFHERLRHQEMAFLQILFKRGWLPPFCFVAWDFYWSIWYFWRTLTKNAKAYSRKTFNNRNSLVLLWLKRKEIIYSDRASFYWRTRWWWEKWFSKKTWSSVSVGDGGSKACLCPEGICICAELRMQAWGTAEDFLAVQHCASQTAPRRHIASLRHAHLWYLS